MTDTVCMEFEPAVCVHTVHTHRRFKMTLRNADQAHGKYPRTTKINFSQAQLITPWRWIRTFRNMLEWFLIVF